MTDPIGTVAPVDKGAQTIADARMIPYLSHGEAIAMATVELERFLALLDELEPEEWGKPTGCARWNVRQVVAHLAGSADAYSNFREFLRQGNGRLQRPYREAGMSRLDAMNQIAVDDRADLTPTELIAQLRERGPRAIRTRERLPNVLRHLPVPLGKITPEIGRTWVPIRYLTDAILTRDMWMHRLDISRATGRGMSLTPEHDGRVTALAVRDLAQGIDGEVDGGVIYALDGPAGGSWLVGHPPHRTLISLDALDFHLLASGRLPLSEARERLSIEGDPDLAERALQSTSVPY